MNERFVAEPSTCDSALEFKHLIEKFGPATGRYLATYPSIGWESMLKQHTEQWGEVEKEKIKTLLRRAKESRALVKARSVAYDDKIHWVGNVVQAQASRSPFDGVIVSRAEAGQFPSIEDVNLPPTAAESIEAKAAEYARIACILLQASSELHFIDPYLDPCAMDRSPVLHRMLGEACSSGRCESVHVWVRSDQLRRSIAETLGALQSICAAAGYRNPCTLSLNAFTDAQRRIKVHDRYLLTLHGGIRFEHGFQELTGRRRANVEPQTPDSHARFVKIFLQGENDLDVERYQVVL